MLGYYLISVRKDKKKLRRLVHERPKKCVFSAKNLIAAPMAFPVLACGYPAMPALFAKRRDWCMLDKCGSV